VTKLIELQGKQFGRLFVLQQMAAVAGRTMFECRCDCGALVSVRAENLRKGETQSCGCYRRDALADLRRTHGLRHSITYKSWHMMHQRCSNPNNGAYKNYGGRGISICERWNKFENFHADMGDRPPGKSIDRIDNDGNYSQENCRWATPLQQNRNKKRKAAA